jgi:hypothetical protein
LVCVCSFVKQASVIENSRFRVFRPRSLDSFAVPSKLWSEDQVYAFEAVGLKRSGSESKTWKVDAKYATKEFKTALKKAMELRLEALG